MSKTTNKYSPEVRERAVRLVFDNEDRHVSRWAAIVSISSKVGCAAQTLTAMKRGDVNSRGTRPRSPVSKTIWESGSLVWFAVGEENNV